MLEPHRDAVSLTDGLDLPDLPNGAQWNGRIAYLDRDGVLNIGSEDYVNSPKQVILLPDAALAVGALRRAGFRICVVTNQSPIGRGHWDSGALATIHARLRELLLAEDSDAHLDLILHSPYAPWEGAWARKPNPGMLEAGRQLLEAATKDSNLVGLIIRFDDEWTDRADESGSVMVGDRGVDMGAAFEFGVKAIRCDPSSGLAGVIDKILEGAG